MCSSIKIKSSYRLRVSHAASSLQRREIRRRTTTVRSTVPDRLIRAPFPKIATPFLFLAFPIGDQPLRTQRVYQPFTPLPSWIITEPRTNVILSIIVWNYDLDPTPVSAKEQTNERTKRLADCNRIEIIKRQPRVLTRILPINDNYENKIVVSIIVDRSRVLFWNWWINSRRPLETSDSPREILTKFARYRCLNL